MMSPVTVQQYRVTSNALIYVRCFKICLHETDLSVLLYSYRLFISDNISVISGFPVPLANIWNETPVKIITIKLLTPIKKFKNNLFSLFEFFEGDHLFKGKI